MYKLITDPHDWGVYPTTLKSTDGQELVKVTYGYYTECPYAEMDSCMYMTSDTYYKTLRGRCFIDEIAASMDKLVIRDKCGNVVAPREEDLNC